VSREEMGKKRRKWLKGRRNVKRRKEMKSMEERGK